MKKCGVCGVSYKNGETISGTIIGIVMGRAEWYWYEQYDLCTNCAKVFESYLRDALHQLKRELGEKE